MLLIDTSVWILVLRDRAGNVAEQLAQIIQNQDVVLSRFSQLELLQGCRDEPEWSKLQSYLDNQDYLSPTDQTWECAARIYFDLRRQGLTVRSSIDCCIAQLALENQCALIHCDRDFERISQIRPLQHIRFNPKPL